MGRFAIVRHLSESAELVTEAKGLGKVRR